MTAHQPGHGPRVLVCGGRDYADRPNVERTLGAIGPSCIIHGGARGADKLAGEWAQSAGVPVEVYEADWSQGPSGGPKRNARMLAEGVPDLVVAFPGGRGTADMVRRARERGVRVEQAT